MVIQIECPSCTASFPVDPNKIPEAGVNARCSSCGEVFRVERPAPPEELAPEPVVEAEPTPEADAVPEAEAEAEASDDGADDGFSTAVDDAPAEEAAAEESAPASPGAGSFFGGGGAPAVAEDEAALEAAPEDEAVAEAPAEEPAVEEEPAPDFSYEAPAEEAPEEPAAEAAIEEPAADEAVADEPAPEEEAAPAVSGFSFGKRDPKDKAKRLARVLVSDMTMYNAELHEKALSGGTLKEDFEEEIDKSWKEYVDQVGQEMAEGDGQGFWRQALNDVLAKGEEVF